MDKNKLMILATIFFITITFSSIVHLIFTPSQNNASEYRKLSPILPTLFIKTIPISVKPINETSASSIVSSTESKGNVTLFHLMNGITMNDKSNQVKSGDIIYLNMTVLEPVCSIALSSDINSTLMNNTHVTIQIIKDPRCEQGFKALQINEWHKQNQK